jgi:hypothetical protein
MTIDTPYPYAGDTEMAPNYHWKNSDLCGDDRWVMTPGAPSVIWHLFFVLSASMAL